MRQVAAAHSIFPISIKRDILVSADVRGASWTVERGKCHFVVATVVLPQLQRDNSGGTKRWNGLVGFAIRMGIRRIPAGQPGEEELYPLVLGSFVEVAVELHRGFCIPVE